MGITQNVGATTEIINKEGNFNTVLEPSNPC